MSRILLVVFLGLSMLALVIVSQQRTAPSYVSGILEAEEIRLGSRIGGRVSEVHVDEGDSVTQTQPLIEFEPYDLLEREQQAVDLLAEKEAFFKKISTGLRSEEIAQAKIRYDEALAQLSLVKEGSRKEEIAATENRLDAANAVFKLAEREYDRLEKLVQSNSITRSEFDAADERFKAASATVKVRENELAILKAGSRDQEIEIAKTKAENLRLAWELAKQGFRTEEIEQAKAARDATRAALEAIRKQKAELTLIAPTAGTIDSLDLQPGALVAPNAPVLTLLSNGNLWVRAYVPQRLMKVRIGQKLRVTLDSFPDENFEGEVTFIAQQAEFTPSNVQTPDDRAKQVYRVRVTLMDKEKKLRPGMTANVWLDEADDTDE